MREKHDSSSAADADMEPAADAEVIGDLDLPDDNADNVRGGIAASTTCHTLAPKATTG